MKRLKLIACMLLLVHASGCATIVYPRRAGLPEEKRGGIDCGVVLTDIFFTAGLGLIVDFIHGTIYRPVEGYRGRGYDRGLFSNSASTPIPGPDP